MIAMCRDLDCVNKSDGPNAMHRRLDIPLALLACHIPNGCPPFFLVVPMGYQGHQQAHPSRTAYTLRSPQNSPPSLQPMATGSMVAPAYYSGRRLVLDTVRSNHLPHHVQYTLPPTPRDSLYSGPPSSADRFLGPGHSLSVKRWSLLHVIFVYDQMIRNYDSMSSLAKTKEKTIYSGGKAD